MRRVGNNKEASDEEATACGKLGSLSEVLFLKRTPMLAGCVDRRVSGTCETQSPKESHMMP